MKLTVEMIEKLKGEYDIIFNDNEAFGFISALRTLGISNEDILKITTK